MSTRDRLLLFLLLLVLPLVLVACTPVRGGGGGGGKDDDDAGDDDDDAAGDEIAASLTHDFELEMGDITELGGMLGLTPCTATMTGSVARDDAADTCATCDAVWTGPITGTQTDCSGMTMESDTFTYGLETLTDGVGVWEWSSDDQAWSHAGDAVWDGAGFILEVEEIMGEGEIILGTSWLTYVFE